MERYLKIVAKTTPNQYWCKKCKRSHNVLYKDMKNPKISFCDNCVTDKSKFTTVNQNQKEIN
ncbi:hypothetical protein [Clostridium paraputrificum]|uniref:hypothetical protein n=1 Tax=Clostridium paraputrificum TaxID=29363 RepID=UPI00189DDAFA|nr:hypothetical protein [Clostridium paraputrificum]